VVYTYMAAILDRWRAWRRPRLLEAAMQAGD